MWAVPSLGRNKGGALRILVACEESQAVTIELRRLGHEAYSCDIQECSGGGSFVASESGRLGTAEDVVGHDHSFPAVYASFLVWAALVHQRHQRSETPGGCRGFFHEVRKRGLSTDSYRKSHRHHVHEIQKTGSNHTTLAIRAPCNKAHMLVAQRAAAS